MQIAARSYLTAGVALVGAAAIAVTPINPILPDVQVPATHFSAVELSAAVNPIATWAEVFGTAFSNTSALAGEVLAYPAPALRQLILNQLAYGQIVSDSVQGAITALLDILNPENDWSVQAQLSRAVEMLKAGDIAGAVTGFLQLPFGLVIGPVFSLLNVVAIPVQMVQNFANVVAALPQQIVPIGLGTLQPVLGAISALADSAQNIFNAVTAGDALGTVAALLNAPAVITGAILNGYTTQWAENPTTSLGLLSPFHNAFDTGVIAALVVGLPRAIAQALGAPSDSFPSAARAAASSDATPDASLTSVSALPSGTGNTITVALRTAPKVAVPVGETPATSVTPPVDSAPALGESAPAAGSGTTGNAGSGSATSTGATGSEASTGPNPGRIVRDSPKATPGRTGTTQGTPGAEINKVAKSVSDGLNSALSKIGQGHASVVKPDKSGTEGAGTGGASGGSSSSSDGSSGSE